MTEEPRPLAGGRGQSAKPFGGRAEDQRWVPDRFRGQWREPWDLLRPGWNLATGSRHDRCAGVRLTADNRPETDAKWTAPDQ